MTTTSTAIRSPLVRLPTNVAGLDTILRGGLFCGGVYMIQGVPGTGKTILANQICFSILGSGGKVVYMTLLAESHSRLIQQLQSLRFFDRTALPDRIYYISAFRQLQTGGLSGILSTAQSEVASHGATMLVIDGFSVAAEAAQSAQEMKRLVHDLQALATFHGCTVLLLTSGDRSVTKSEDTMVDGLLYLEAEMSGAQPERRLSVIKSRGDAALSGAHSFLIDDTGLKIFPRLESVFDQPPGSAPPEAVVSSGVASLDAMLEAGGLPACSSTVVMGPSGSGKTSLALQFLSQCSAESPGLALGFFESPERLLRKADALGLPLRDAVRLAAIEFIWRAPGSYLLDEIGYLLLEEIDERGVQRLVIDGMAGIFGAIGYPQRQHRFVACLMNEIRRRGVTVMLTLETSGTGPTAVFRTPDFGLSAWVDNLITLHQIRSGTGVAGAISIGKIRDSGYDRSIRGFEITGSGVALGSGLALAERREV